MKIRTKFTLFISLASLVSVAFFSGFLYSEITEEIYELIDIELSGISDTIFRRLEHTDPTQRSPAVLAPSFSSYWLRVYTHDNQTLLMTDLAKHGSFEPSATDVPSFVTLSIPHSLIHIPASEKQETSGDLVKLRTRTFHRRIGGEEVVVQIAKPVLLLNAELQEILLDMYISIPLIILLILVTAYLVAGRMLQPLADINSKITRIRENSLNERIPLGRSRDELHALSSSLNSMFDRLEYSFARQREFIGNAAHEMKSPLTILMLGHEEMLAAEPPEEIRNGLERQLLTMQRLNKLIRDLLSIARLEQEDTLVRTVVDIPELLRQNLEDYAELIHDKGIELTTSFSPLVISADQEKIQRLCINLIDNGVKYNLEHNGRLYLNCRREKEMAIIGITNSGATIPPEDIPHIFKQFYRVEKSRSHIFGGTGLGLTIASRIAEMHGGRITVTSNAGITTFTVTLPDILPA